MNESDPNPQNTYAVIVGIEKSVSENLPGAASSALGFAKWLYEQKIPKENIFLFISELDENKSLVENCQFNVRKAISCEIVDDAIATKIRKKQGEGYILYIFWAGHGYINQVENRRLLFSIEEQVKEKQLSLSMLLKQLRTDDFSCFDKQILLIDACATYYTFTNYLDVPIPGGENPNNNCEQIVLLATKPGETAKYNNNSGLFSEVLFTELRNKDKLLLPEEMKEIVENIRKVFNEDEKYKNEQTPIDLWYSYRHKDGREKEERLGLTKSAQISILLKERLKGLSSILSEISDRYILSASCYFVLLGFSKDVNGNYPEIDLLKSEDTAQEKIPKILEELLFKLTNNKDAKPVIEFVFWLLIILINSEEIKKKLKDWNKKTRDELNKINIRLNIKPIKTKIDNKIISYREAYKNCHPYLVIVYKPKFSGKIYLSAELIFQKDNDEAKLKFQIAHEIEVALTNIHDKFDKFLLFSYKIINLYGFTDKQLIVEIFLPIQQLKKHSDESYEKIEIKIDDFYNDRQWIGCYHKFAFRSFERLDYFYRVPLSTIKEKWDQINALISNEQEIKKKIEWICAENHNFKSKTDPDILGINLLCFSETIIDESIKKILREGLPLFIWIRRICVEEENIRQEFEDLLRVNNLDNLLEKIRKKRLDAFNLEEQKQDYLGYNLGFLCDNPYRLPSQYSIVGCDIVVNLGINQ